VIRHHSSSPNAKDAYYRASLNLAKLERWREVEESYWAIRQLESLNSMDELEARVGLGVALFMQGEYATAEREFMSALTFFESKKKDEYLPATYWVAQSRFYLGEIYARHFETVKLESAEADPEKWKDIMAGLLEAKCEHLLRSQNNLIRAIRVGHTGWATAAGFRIGSLYERLYDEMVDVAIPPGLGEEAGQYYMRELRQRLGVLVSKAVKIYERSLQMAERVGEKNDWVDRTAQALDRMKNLALESLEKEENGGGETDTSSASAGHAAAT
jgi:tetratricopeptide (TPR) repeat protein